MTDFPSYPRGLWRSALPPAVVYGRHWARWTVGTDSLAAGLRAVSSRFHVQLLGQWRAMPLRDEWCCLGMSDLVKTLIREALLTCNEIPMVYVHTIVHPRSAVLDWPFLKTLRAQPLGHSLLTGPRVQRGDFEFVPLDAHHPLVYRAHDTLGGAPVAGTARLPARRSVFWRGTSAMLMTGVFLPTLVGFHPPRQAYLAVRAPGQRGIIAPNSLSPRLT